MRLIFGAFATIVLAAGGLATFGSGSATAQHSPCNPAVEVCG